MVTDGINKFIELDKRVQLKKVNLGIRAFQKCKNKHNGTNIVYRITQEGLQSLFKCYTKRKLKVSIDSLMFLARNQNIKHTDIPEDQKEIRDIVNDPELGYFTLYVEEAGVILELTTLLKFRTSLSLMASDEMIAGIKIKYSKEFNMEEIVKPDPKANKKEETMAEDK